MGVDFGDVKYAAQNVYKNVDGQAKFWAVVFGGAFFTAYGGLNCFSSKGEHPNRPADQKFFKWGGIYSRFHPEVGCEVGREAEWHEREEGEGLSSVSSQMRDRDCGF